MPSGNGSQPGDARRRLPGRARCPVQRQAKDPAGRRAILGANRRQGVAATSSVSAASAVAGGGRMRRIRPDLFAVQHMRGKIGKLDPGDILR